METTFQILQSPVVTCQAVRYPVTLILSDSSSIRFRCITEKQAETVRLKHILIPPCSSLAFQHYCLHSPQLVRAIKGIERPPLPAPWSQADLKHVEPVAREFRKWRTCLPPSASC